MPINRARRAWASTTRALPKSAVAAAKAPSVVERIRMRSSIRMVRRGGRRTKAAAAPGEEGLWPETPIKVVADVGGLRTPRLHGTVVEYRARVEAITVAAEVAVHVAVWFDHAGEVAVDIQSNDP